MVDRQNIIQRKIYYQLSTTNQSFIECHNYLKDIGTKNNKFFLTIIDPDLAGIDPRDPHLNSLMKQKVLRECMCNYWYFLREVIRIPEQGGSANSGARYKLHRGNLALNFCLEMNFNVFAEFPRQHGKTIAIVCRFLWEFLYGTTNSEMMMINKKHDDSKMNLQRLKDIRSALPAYLQMDAVYNGNMKLKPKNSVETLEHPTNGNKIKTLASARNKVNANSLGRGCTQPRQWYDEYAFIPYNNIIYLSATPAYKTASMNAKRNHAPYGLIITTTPGDLTTEEGMDAFLTKDMATKFSENWYDMSYTDLTELVGKNNDSPFIYIRYTYTQLGSGEQWFRDIVVEMKKDWSAIRREVLLEWSKASDNSPFKKEDLNVVKSLLKEPIQKLNICGYDLNIYEKMHVQTYPPIIGVDVSGGFKRDSSAITIIDSLTTKVIADLNCNYISTGDLARVIYVLVTKYMPNAIVNVERNGGFGASVLTQLIKTKIKRNLYFEIKDKVIEERFNNGMNTVKKTQKTKIYGLDSSHSVRDSLMEILKERMEYHKDKFVSPIIGAELETLEVKKNGKIEHTSTGHDDQVFSYLMALYVWYNGKDVMETWGIDKRTLKTDNDLEKAIVPLEEKYNDVVENLEAASDEYNLVEDQLKMLNDNTKLYETWLQDQYKKDQQAMDRILSSKIGREAYVAQFNADDSEINTRRPINIPDEIFDNFYK